MSAATRNRRTSRTRTPDRLCAEAVESAREAAEEAARPGRVGDWLEAVSEGDRVVTHYFECLEPGYRGWRWATTVTRASRAKVVTLDESVLLPGPDAVLAPQWVPWSERLRPGDLGPGDLLPTEADDLRLEPGYTGEDAPPPHSVLSEEAEEAEQAEVLAEAPGLVEAEDAELSTGSPAAQGGPPVRGGIAAVAEELGMGRARVLSRYGLQIAADRWEEVRGPGTGMAQSAPASCVTCGFLVPLTGSLRQAFGVCANEYSPADGQVVSLAYGCGGHSEAAVMPQPPQPPPPVIDETRSDPFALREDEGAENAGEESTGPGNGDTNGSGKSDSDAKGNGGGSGNGNGDSDANGSGDSGANGNGGGKGNGRRKGARRRAGGRSGGPGAPEGDTQTGETGAHH